MEDETDHGPRGEVDTSGWRHAHGTEPEDGNVDVAEDRSWVFAGEEVEGEWSKGTSEHKPNHRVISRRVFSR